jgi:hypothetical protein
MDNLKNKKSQYIEKQNNLKNKYINNNKSINKEEDSFFEYLMI